MKFKGLILIIAAAVILAGCSGGQKQETAQMTLTYANFPPAATFPCVQMERWKEEVEKRTGGRVKVNTFPGGTLLGAKNMFDGVVSGAADIGNLAMSYQPGRFPVCEAVDLPLRFSSSAQATEVLYRILEKYPEKEFEKVKVLTVFTCPPAAIMTTRKVSGLNDLAGLALRVSGTGAELIKALGANPVAMPQSETPDAIQKGTVEGMVSSMEVLKDFNFAAYCPFALKADLNVISFAVVMNKGKYDSLPEDIKKVLDDLSHDQASWTARYVDSHVLEALEWSKEKYGLTVYEFTPEDEAEVENRLFPLIEQYIERADAAGLSGQAIVEEAARLRCEYGEGKE